MATNLQSVIHSIAAQGPRQNISENVVEMRGGALLRGSALGLRSDDGAGCVEAGGQEVHRAVSLLRGARVPAVPDVFVAADI